MKVWLPTKPEGSSNRCGFVIKEEADLNENEQQFLIEINEFPICATQAQYRALAARLLWTE